MTAPASDDPSIDEPEIDDQLPRRARLERIMRRDGSRCVWCGRHLADGRVPATTEHVVPRVKGGPSWIENEVAACRRCNGERGHRTPAEWLDECERRGWDPSPKVIVASLERLAQAIERRGGQRRARPYLASQLRRLHRRSSWLPRVEVRGAPDHLATRPRPPEA